MLSAKIDGLWSRLRVARLQLERASHGAGPTLRLSLMAEIVCDLDLEKARGRVALPLAGGVVWRGVLCWSVGDSRRIAVSTGLGS